MRCVTLFLVCLYVAVNLTSEKSNNIIVSNYSSLIILSHERID